MSLGEPADNDIVSLSAENVTMHHHPPSSRVKSNSIPPGNPPSTPSVRRKRANNSPQFNPPSSPPPPNAGRKQSASTTNDVDSNWDTVHERARGITVDHFEVTVEATEKEMQARPFEETADWKESPTSSRSATEMVTYLKQDLSSVASTMRNSFSQRMGIRSAAVGNFPGRRRLRHKKKGKSRKPPPKQSSDNEDDSANHSSDARHRLTDSEDDLDIKSPSPPPPTGLTQEDIDALDSDDDGKGATQSWNARIKTRVQKWTSRRSSTSGLRQAGTTLHLLNAPDSGSALAANSDYSLDDLMLEDPDYVQNSNGQRTRTVHVPSQRRHRRALDDDGSCCWIPRAQQGRRTRAFAEWTRHVHRRVRRRLWPCCVSCGKTCSACVAFLFVFMFVLPSLWVIGEFLYFWWNSDEASNAWFPASKVLLVSILRHNVSRTSAPLPGLFPPPSSGIVLRPPSKQFGALGHSPLDTLLLTVGQTHSSARPSRPSRVLTGEYDTDVDCGTGDSGGVLCIDATTAYRAVHFSRLVWEYVVDVSNCDLLPDVWVYQNAQLREIELIHGLNSASYAAALQQLDTTVTELRRHWETLVSRCHFSAVRNTFVVEGNGRIGPNQVTVEEPVTRAWFLN